MVPFRRWRGRGLGHCEGRVMVVPSVIQGVAFQGCFTQSHSSIQPLPAGLGQPGGEDRLALSARPGQVGRCLGQAEGVATSHIINLFA